MIRVYIAFVLIGYAASQVCQDVTVKPDFNITEFVGEWYEVEYIENEFGGKCVTLTYTANENGTINVERKQLDTSSNAPSSIEGNVMQDENEKAKLLITVPSRNFTSPYWILDTDYNSFAAIWHCVNGSKNAWLLAREPEPEGPVLENAYEVFGKNGINRSELRKMDRQNCTANL